MNPGNVNSHIQMPRFLLTRFENENHSFFYYDVKERYIGANGHAKSMYTERGYYPDVIEKYLNKELERPFSQFLQFVDSILDKPSFAMTNADENTIKQFLASLIIRSPLFIDSLKNNSVFFQFLSPTDQHTIAISRGMEEAQKKAAEEEAQKQKQQQVQQTSTKTVDNSKAATSADNVSGSKTLTMSATAYSTEANGMGTYSATGINLKQHPSCVAVDPSVIPLGSIIWVSGYGVSVAGDTGTAIKGNVIDLHFATVAQSMAWGRRTVTVKILN